MQQCSLDIRHDPIAHQFSTLVDDEACELDYQLVDTVMTITHTGVPAAVGGRGIASALVGTAFAEAAKKGWKVVPACAYAAAWIKRHPELTDQLA